MLDAPLLTVLDAQKVYGTVRALRGASFELRSGELLGLLGPNGAGKTTLMRSIAGRCRLDGGSLQFHPMLKGRQQLGFVPQTLAIYEDLTANQNLHAFGRLQGIHRRELPSRVNTALEWANLSDRKHHLASTFSGGMKRRLNIAAAVLHQPKVLLLDEPTVGVDPQSRERIYDMLSELRQRGTAILLTTHQLDEAQHRCDRVAIVDEGTVIAEGTVQQLIADTVGSGQRLSIKFKTPPPALPDWLIWSEGTEKDKAAICRVKDATIQLPQVMQTLSDVGAEVDSFVLQSPTLQHAFLHLTGRELRE